MTGIAEHLDDLRIALGEVDVLAILTAGAFDAEDWVDPIRTPSRAWPAFLV